MSSTRPPKWPLRPTATSSWPTATPAAAPPGNARVVKFDKNGKFIKTWGKKGMGPGEFDAPHTLAFDSRGRLFVGDRQNNRIQIFDQDGKFIAQWFQFGRPSGIYIDKGTGWRHGGLEPRDGRNKGIWWPQRAAPSPVTGYLLRQAWAPCGIRTAAAVKAW